jgi:hypothetical protein
MASMHQARMAFTAARDFFGQAGALKSTNKAYIDPTTADDAGWSALGTVLQLAEAKGITPDDALAKIRSRAAARLQARNQGEYEAMMSGATPVQYGEITVRKNSPTGNCGVMACVAMHYASMAHVPVNEMFLVTAYNQTTRAVPLNPFDRTTWNSETMEFGHSWALLGLGTKDNPEFIVDPWAGIVCASASFEQKLKAKLDEWQGQGKRIAVNYTNSTYWLQANHHAVRSLFGAGSTREKIRGDEHFK